MRFLTKHLKFIIGVSVLVLATFVFAITIKSTDNLETGRIKDWQRASVERKTAAVQMITASADNLDILIQCVDKYSSLPGATDMTIQTAVALCYNGLQTMESL